MKTIIQFAMEMDLLGEVRFHFFFFCLIFLFVVWGKGGTDPKIEETSSADKPNNPEAEVAVVAARTTGIIILLHIKVIFLFYSLSLGELGFAFL